MEPLVTCLDEVYENIIQFNKDLEEETVIISQLTQFIHWYYLPELNLFAPSKYIGYRKMNTKKYNRGFNKSGVESEKILKQWFIKLERTSEESMILIDQLTDTLEKYNKKLRSNAVIHVLKDFKK